jgi:hypothetical protein
MNTKIITSLNEIHSEEAKSNSLLSGLRKALRLEGDAEKALQLAREERARVEQVQKEWQKMVEEIYAMKKRVDVAADQVRNVREGIESYKSILQENIGETGSPGWPIRPAAMAENLAALSSSLPLMESAERELQEMFWARVADVREHGRKRGVPKAALDSLPVQKKAP